jgi:hypothetical protein
VLVGLGEDQQAALVEVGDDRRVGRLHPDAGEGARRLGEGAVGSDRVQHGEALGRPDGRVLLAEGGGEVDDAAAVVGADVVGGHHPLGGVGVAGR